MKASRLTPRRSCFTEPPRDRSQGSRLLKRDYRWMSHLVVRYQCFWESSRCPRSPSVSNGGLLGQISNSFSIAVTQALPQFLYHQPAGVGTGGSHPWQRRDCQHSVESSQRRRLYLTLRHG